MKCTTCGLVNFASQGTCRRCGGGLLHGYAPLSEPARTTDDRRGFWEYLLWTSGVALTILTISYASLLLTSDAVTAAEREAVASAIEELDRAGFSQQTFALRHLVSFRRTDNWWNRSVGHPAAYAATNFPFAVVTLYPPFFKYPVDDRERAAILLHEAYHLFGDDEGEALQRVWQQKNRLGWTRGRYSHTRVWKNTQEWTHGSVPALFTCGGDGQSDCLD
jgi:hypothetical protein